MSEDTIYLNLPRVARPDTITMQRGEVGDSLTLAGSCLIMGSGACWPVTFLIQAHKHQAVGTCDCRVGHFYPASECDSVRLHPPGF